MTDPVIPVARESAYDVLARHIAELNDRRLNTAHRIRVLHSANESGRCRCCSEPAPCRTMLVIDGAA